MEDYIKLEKAQLQKRRTTVENLEKSQLKTRKTTVANLDTTQFQERKTEVQKLLANQTAQDKRIIKTQEEQLVEKDRIIQELRSQNETNEKYKKWYNDLLIWTKGKGLSYQAEVGDSVSFLATLPRPSPDLPPHVIEDSSGERTVAETPTTTTSDGIQTRSRNSLQ